MNRKGSAILLVVGFVVLLVVIFTAGYLLRKSSMESTPQPSMQTQNLSAVQASLIPSSTILSSTTSDNSSGALNFPVPPLYPGENWNFVSTTFETDFYLVSPATDGGALSISVQGEAYEATNTDSSLLTWENATNTYNGFYGGDPNFLSYYGQALTNEGYQQELDFDQDLNPVIQNASTVYYAFEYDSVGDYGPEGPENVYMLYHQGSIRVIAITSQNPHDEVFVSNIINLKNLISEIPASSPPATH